MLFKDMKQGYQVYILDKNTLDYKTGKIVSVSQPHLPGQQPLGGYTTSMQLYVDATIETNGNTQTYSIPDSLGITYSGNLVLSTSKDGIIREVEAVKANSENAIKDVDTHKKRLTLCDTLLSDLNPEFADKKKQEERINGLEEEVRGLGTMLKDFIASLKHD